MAAPSYKSQGLVLRKTKLGEKDLIITFLGERGSLLKAIAKGARKPGGSHAAKLELFSVVDGLFTQGKNLDIITDSKLISEGMNADGVLERMAVATPLSELLSIVAQEDLEQPRLYDLSVSAFQRIRTINEESVLALSTAAIWKVVSQVGFKPSLTTCVICGEPVELDSDRSSIADERLPDHKAHMLFFSPIEGGVICERCLGTSDVLHVDPNILLWCQYLINSRFDEIEEQHLDNSCAFALLSLARIWIRVHIGKDIRSLDFLFTSGLFDTNREE